MPSKEDAAHREIMQQLCVVIIDYLGVSQVIDSLDATRQDLCCQRHCFPDWEEDCSVPSFEPSKRCRRPESTLDWAMLTTMYTRDFAAIPGLLKSQFFHLGSPSPELPASLQYSAGYNYETIFRLLLEAGVNINSLAHATGSQFCNESEFNYGSALEAACAAGHMGIVKVCLSPNYNLNSSGVFYESAMTIAASLDNHETALNMVKFLLSRLTSWHDLSGTTQVILSNTCRNGDIYLGKLIFENAPYNLNVRRHNDECLLSMAVEHDHADMVMYILSQLQTCMDRFPHHEASQWRDTQLRRAIRRAAEFGRAHIASLLWTELKSYPMQSLLCIAARHGHINMIEFLLSRGLDLSTEYSSNGHLKTNGENALILAIEHAHESATRFLLGLGIRTLNLRSFSPMEGADPGNVARSEEGVENLLLAYGLGPVPSKRK